jgi:hypothetical protein
VGVEAYGAQRSPSPNPLPSREGNQTVGDDLWSPAGTSLIVAWELIPHAILVSFSAPLYSRATGETIEH